MLFAWIDEIQRRNGIAGDIFEIGCHHGKSSALLGAMVRMDRERLSVCDLFGDQDANISGSGSGDLETFKRNMSLIHQTLNLRIFDGNSRRLSTKEIGNSYRFFHIDGGHDYDEVLSDLRLAAASTIRDGVIVLDDPFQPEWPGVTEAVIRFLNEQEQYHAIAVGFNKLIVVRSENSNLYLAEFLRAEDRESYGLSYPWNVKQLRFVGRPLQIFYVPTRLSGRPLIVLAARYYQTHHWTRSQVIRPLIKAAKRLLRG